MSFSTRVMTASDWGRILHFKAADFKHPEKMGYEFMVWLEWVRQTAAVPMNITSSYRDAAYNKAVGGAKDSAHSDVPCSAVDIGKHPTPTDPNWNAARFAIISAALKCGCTRIGMYSNGSLHLDRTEDVRPAKRIWIAVDNPA